MNGSGEEVWARAEAVTALNWRVVELAESLREHDAWFAQNNPTEFRVHALDAEQLPAASVASSDVGVGE